MKKISLCIVAIGLSLILQGCGGTPKTSTKSSDAVSSSETDNASSEALESSSSKSPSNSDAAASEMENEASDINAIGKTKVEKGWFDVKITIPKELVQKDASLDAEQEDGVFKIERNADGSETFYMSKQKHQAILQSFQEQFKENSNKIIANSKGHRIVKIESNPTFTDHKVYLNATELNLEESMLTMQFSMQGAFYGIFSGDKATRVHVQYIHAKTGDIIEDWDTDKLKSSQQ